MQQVHALAIDVVRHCMVFSSTRNIGMPLQHARLISLASIIAYTDWKSNMSDYGYVIVIKSNNICVVLSSSLDEVN